MICLLLLSSSSHSLHGEYRNALALHIGQADLNKALGAWPLLIRLISANVHWANELGENHWPSERKAQLALLRQLPRDLLGLPWVQDKLKETVWKVSPSALAAARIFPHLLEHIEDASDTLIALRYLSVSDGASRLAISVKTKKQDLLV